MVVTETLVFSISLNILRSILNVHTDPPPQPECAHVLTRSRTQTSGNHPGSQAGPCAKEASGWGSPRAYCRL